MGSRASCCGGKSSFFGFDSFGSFPSFKALVMRAAFHLAYLIFCDVSTSGGPHMLTKLKKVRAASNVLAVCCVTLFALMTLSALSNVSWANCSTYASAAASSVIASSFAYSFLVYRERGSSVTVFRLVTRHMVERWRLPAPVYPSTSSCS